MLFQEITPDTSGYMIAGYAIAFIVLGLYVASMAIRNRNLHQDIAMLEEMEKPAAKGESRARDPKKSGKSVTKKSGKK